jgi:hypothetical protein
MNLMRPMAATGRYRRGEETPWGNLRFTGRDGTEWVPPAHPEEESARLYGYKAESQVKMSMSPEEYRHLAEQIWVHRQGVDPSKLASIKERETEEAHDRGLAKRFRSGEVVDAAFLDIDPDTMDPVSQEGAHRTALAEALGMKKIPVIVYARGRHGHEMASSGFRERLRRYGEVVG